MANGNPLNNLEHDNLSPQEYSLPIERDYSSKVRRLVSRAINQQSYLASEYTGVIFQDYSGIVMMMPPSPIIIPNIPIYNGIAPIGLMPQIDPPYPYETELV